MWCVKFFFINTSNNNNNNNNIIIIIIIIIIILLLLLLLFFFKQSQTWTEMLRKMDVAMFSFKIKLLKALGNFKHSPFLQKNNVEV